MPRPRCWPVFPAPFADEHCRSRAPQVRLVLFRKRATYNPDLEPRTIGAAGQLDDAGSRALDDVDDRTQRLPFPLSRFPVVCVGDGGHDAVSFEPACHVPLEGPPGGVPTMEGLIASARRHARPSGGCRWTWRGS